MGKTPVDESRGQGADAENHHDTTMSMRAARTLSIPELLQVLGEKVGEEYFTMQEIPLSFALSAGSLEPEVRTSCRVG